MPTLTLPLGTYTAGTHCIGPAVLSPALAVVALTVRRDVGLSPWNDQMRTTTMHVEVAVAVDGITWNSILVLDMEGGTFADRWTGDVFVTSGVSAGLPGQGVTGRQGQASMILVGGPVSFSGTLTVL